MIVSIFTNDAALIEFTCGALSVYLAAAFMMGFQMAFQQSFIALGEAKISLFLALLRKIILLIPLILILPKLLSNKLFAVFLAEPVSDFLAASTTTVIFLIRFRQILKELRGEPVASAS